MKNRKAWAACLMAAGVMALCMTGEAFAYGTEPFDKLENIIFEFSSGAGGWSTHMWIGGNGSFWGRYHDSDMGTTGEGYSYGTVYTSDFVGMFSDPVQIDDYTYRIHMDYVSSLKTPGEPDRILHEIQYVYTDPYGANGGEDYYLYLPGKPKSDLPEGYLIWALYPLEGKDYLDGYGLYCESEDQGFYGYEMAPEEGSMWESLLETAWEEAKPIYDELATDIAQQPMNIASYEVYQVWDRCLNDMWGYLRSILDAEQMQMLTDEELAWIEDKEAKVREAGAMFLHGSLQPFMESSTAGDFTRQRVYELWNVFQYEG